MNRASSEAAAPEGKIVIPCNMPYIFLAISIIAFALINFLPGSVFAPLNHGTAHLSGLCLALLGRHAEVAGEMISLDGFRVKIITECTALYSVVLFGAFLFSARASLKAKLTGLLLGGTFLTVANIYRIALITMTGAKYPNLFEIVHIYLGQIIMILLVIGASLAWLRWSSDSADPFLFIITVTVLITLLFIPWLVVNRHYLAALDWVVRFIFSLFGYGVTTPRPLAVYNHTFAIPLFFSLIMALYDLPVRRQIRFLSAGLLIIACWHILFRVSHVLWTAFNINQFEPILQFIYILGQYLLPILLWLMAARSSSLRINRGMVKGTQLVALLLVTLLLARPSDVHAAPTVTVQPNGSGVFSLSVSDLENISRGEIHLNYQIYDQSVPIAGAVALGAQLGLEAITDSPGTIVFRFSSRKPFNGMGMLATISLGDGGANQGQILALSAQFWNDKGGAENARTSIINPSGDDPQQLNPIAAAKLRQMERNRAKEESSEIASRSGETGSTPAASAPGPVFQNGQSNKSIPNPSGPVPFHRLGSVLDRFQKYAGERTPAALARLFAPLPDERFIQTPALLIADGAATLLISFRLTGEGETVNLFLIRGANCIASRIGEPGEWILQLIPERGTVDASVTVQTNREMVEYPLTVAPRLADYLPTEGDRGHPYILDFVRTANELAGPSVTADNHFPGAPDNKNARNCKQ